MMEEEKDGEDEETEGLDCLAKVRHFGH